jgi:hypothetical protein
MKRLVAAIAANSPFVASAEVLDKQPSVTFLLAAAASAGLIAFAAARHAQRRLALLGLLPILVFIPALSEQLDPLMRRALLVEGGALYLFCVWLGPASALLAFAGGMYRRRRPLGKPLLPVVFFTAVSVLGGLGLSTLSGLSAVAACAVVAIAVLVNGLIATAREGHA